MSMFEHFRRWRFWGHVAEPQTLSSFDICLCIDRLQIHNMNEMAGDRKTFGNKFPYFSAIGDRCRCGVCALLWSPPPQTYV